MAHSALADYTCGVSGCWNPGPGSWDCVSGLTCSGNNGTCGAYVNICNGTKCEANTWDQGAHGCANECDNGGTNNTAAFAACSVSCGPGTELCQCTHRNSCPDATCTDGPYTRTCNTTAPCCHSQAPLTAPVITSCDQITEGVPAVLKRKVNVNWTYGNMGCGQQFGYNCNDPPGNSFHFNLNFQGNGGGKDPETEDFTAAPSYTHKTLPFPKWGTYQAQVCADNGVAPQNCSGWVDCTMNQPACEVSGQDVANATPNTECISEYPQLVGQYGNGANEIQFLVHDSSSTSLSAIPPYNNPPYPVTSSWINTPSPVTYVAALNNTGTYYWNVHSRSNLPAPTPADCYTPAAMPTGLTLNIDRSAPSVPALDPVPTFTVNQKCLSEYFMTLNWGSVTDAGCAPAPISYETQIASDSAVTAQITDDTNWITPPLTRTTANAFTSVSGPPTGKKLYAHVRSKDSIGNTSAYSSVVTYTVPTPTAYPPITIRGTYVEDIGYTDYNTCVEGMSIDSNNLLLNINVAGVGQSQCTVNTNDYVCTIILDNQSTKCMVPDHSVTVANTTYAGYTSVEWRNNTCGDNTGQAIQIDASTPPPGTVPTPIQAKLYFKYGQQSWFKTSGISFNNRFARSDIIPNNAAAYDGDDSIAPPNNKLFIANEGGAVLQGGAADLTLGANATACSGGICKPTYSANNWYASNYDAASNFTPSKFADYMRSRKAYKNIATTSAILTEGDGVYYYSGNSMAIDSGAFFANRKVVIVADQAVVDITGDITGLGTGALAIIAKGINVMPTVSEVDGILIANTVDIGPAFPRNTTPLKIDGNLIQLSSATEFKNTRYLPNNSRPSFFVKLNQASYTKLLDYLSISVYDWKQVQ